MMQTRAIFSVTCVSAATMAAADQVDVNSGETLTQAELEMLTLGPGTTIDVNNGGTIGPVRSDTDPFFFDFNRATVNISSGGTFASANIAGEISNVGRVDLNVASGGTIGDAFIAGAGTRIDLSGQIGDLLDVRADASLGAPVEDQASVDVQSGGFVGDNADIFRDSGITVFSGGTVGNALDVEAGGILNVVGGSVGNELDVLGGTVFLQGGTIGNNINIEDTGQGAVDRGSLSIFGGSIGNNVDVDGGEISLFVTDLSINGVPQDLDIGEMFSISDFSEDIAFESTLLSGETFNRTFGDAVGDDIFMTDGANLRVFVVPAPGSLALLGLGGLAAMRRRR